MSSAATFASRVKPLEQLGVLKGRTVLLRVDLNLPFEGDKVRDASRVQAVKPTVEYLLKNGAKIILISHRGRPKGKFDPSLSLKPVLPTLEQIFRERVLYLGDPLASLAHNLISTSKENIIMAENLRFHEGEEANDPQFAKALSRLADVYVNDAFSACHRAHASVEAITRFLPSAAGFALISEVKALEKALEHPQRPLAAVIGGAKVSTKIAMLDHLIARVDHLLIGGAMANTFLAAQGLPVGLSLFEKEHLSTALTIINQVKQTSCHLHLPVDTKVKRQEAAVVVSMKEVMDGDRILDIGPETVSKYSEIIATCRTLVWNGPMGLFEEPPFDQGTIHLAQKIAELTQQNQIFSIAGGGDTLAALSRAAVLKKFSLVSTAGGAFLEWLEGRELPGIKALMAESTKNL